jgi:hypothetical protein
MHAQNSINPLNARLNAICHLLVVLGTGQVLHISMIRVNAKNTGNVRIKVTLRSARANVVVKKQ